MTTAVGCWKCGAPLEELPLPLSRRAECPACRIDLHACRMCEFYDPRVSKSCREPIAEEVKDKERANFCGYFRAKPNAYRPPDNAAAQTARSQLDALFGGNANTTPIARHETDAVKERLERLFGGGDKREE